MMRPLIVVGGFTILAAVTLVYAAGLFSSSEPSIANKEASSPNDPIVLIDTSMGQIKVELFETKAPRTVKNFLSYVNDKYYDGLIFHRVIKDFMIQGGGFTKDGEKKPTKPPIVNESVNGLSNERGTIAMARTNEPDSATSQFYINTGKTEKGNPKLDRLNAQDGVGYCVFGKVTEGMDVVNAIQNVPTTTRDGSADVPVEPVIINSIRVVKE